AQARVVNQYEALRAKAREAAIPIDSDVAIAKRAFAISQFLWAKAALENALAEHTFNPAVHRDLTQLAVSTCYSLGAWYTTAPKDSQLYREGLSWLATSQALSAKFHTGQGEAASKLRELVSPRERDWPAPATTPLLSGS